MMKSYVLLLVLLCFPFLVSSQVDPGKEDSTIVSHVDSSNVENMVLKQSFLVQVPLDSVWNAYTTKKGWESWASAIAEIDFKIHGTIKTNYNKDGEIGDAATITLHIINFVPKRMLTLQAELSAHFPEFMKADEERLYNTILFEAIDPSKTRVTSYGIGYRNNAKYQSLMKFFIQGNAQSYKNLINYLETGNPSVNY